MSKNGQRRDTIFAEGKRWALLGWSIEQNPYLHPRARAVWREGWEKGHTELLKRRREGRRRLRTTSTLLGWFWRPVYGALATFHL
ncbi:hypothetical protein LUCX_257 [Xanthomonas phage vB_XciM_LucasX]|nr:hypothetical protein LUCX_257 [Xanthomonas phage vB_XciM_LucasX]